MDAMALVGAVVGLLVGAVAGAFVAWKFATERTASRLERLAAEERDQLANGLKQLRSINVRLQAELDNVKADSSKRLLALSSEQRGSITRLEGQLRFAYAEIDRLRAGPSGHDAQVDEHGFAVTRPYSPPR